MLAASDSLFLMLHLCTELLQRLWAEADTVFIVLHFVNWFLATLTTESPLLAFTCSLADEVSCCYYCYYCLN
jgi:transcriptional antiterminator